MKKFTTILMTCLIMLVVVLTGCSTFKVDKVKYYNEVLAKIGDDVITRFDLINAYNSYGYNNYVTLQGKSNKEALTKTMDLLVQRKLIARHAMDNLDKYSLNEYEVKKLYRDTLDALIESVEGNKETARKIYGLQVEETSQESTDSKETFKLSEYDYKKRVEVVDGQIKYKNSGIEPNADDVDVQIEQKYILSYQDYTQKDIVKQLLNVFKQEFYANQNDEDADLYKKMCDKAIQLTCNNLISYEYYLREDGKRLSTNQEDLLFRLVERTYENQLESAYAAKVNDVYLRNETLSNESVINAFKALYESDYAKYVNDLDAYSKDVIESNGDLIYYAPNSDAEFGYFLHVLLPFNNVEDDLKDLKDSRKDFNYDDETYKSKQMEIILNEMMCAQRTTSEVRDDETGALLYEEGVTLEGEVFVQDVLAEYAAKVRDLNSFKEFMFKYTTDNATLTADMPYVIGYNTETDEEYSTMVANFTDEAIRLMKEGQGNSAYTDSDEFILSNYGIHLLYYIGPVKNQITIENINKVTIEKLANTILNKATGETYLDRVFDLVYPADSDGMFTTNTQYSSYEQDLVDSLYAKYSVVLYETKIKASDKL